MPNVARIAFVIASLAISLLAAASATETPPTVVGSQAHDAFDPGPDERTYATPSRHRVQEPRPLLPQAAVDREERRFTAALGARYMEAGTCADTTYEGWTGFPLKRCSYAVRDGRAGEKRATVVLLDPTPRQLARWVVDACNEVLHTTAVACTSRVRQQILKQSGGQFPVAGIVLEDMDGDGVQNMYVFRDGVTSVVDGVTNGSTERPTAEHIRAAINGPVRRVGRYARVASTSREDYQANGGTVDVGTSEVRKPTWGLVVRELYQQAWGADRNELLIAWLRSHQRE